LKGGEGFLQAVGALSFEKYCAVPQAQPANTKKLEEGKG
jgi:hypothetical protein